MKTKFFLKLVIPIFLFYGFYDTEIFQKKIFLPYAYLHATAISSILKIFGLNTFASENVITTTDYSMIIIRGCDPLEPILIYSALIIAFPAKLVNKLRGILIGTIIFHIINFFMFISLFLIGLYYPTFFNSAHIKWWQIFFILLVVLMWRIWLVTALKNSEKIVSLRK